MNPGERDDLNCWKEIAAHLGVSTRTAQLWERERGLPVRRPPGKRGAVSSTRALLDEWRATRPLEPPPAAQNNGAWLTRRRGAIVAGACALLIGAAAFLWPPPPNPASVRVATGDLEVLSASGARIWSRPIVPPQHPERTSTLPSDAPNTIVDDLDGDGSSEVVFAQSPAEIRPRGAAVICYDRKGRERWRFYPGRAIESYSESFTNTFAIRAMARLHNRNRSDPVLAVAANHVPYYPSQVALLRADGTVTHEYWHPGHITVATAADVDGDGRDEIWLGGVNNARSLATLVVLEPHRMPGGVPAATLEQGPYRFKGMPPAAESRRFLLPRSCFGPRTDKYNWVTQLLPRETGMLINVAETIEGGGSVLYHFGRDLKLLRAEPTDDFERRHARLAMEGVVDHPLSLQERSRFAGDLISIASNPTAH